jgi:hypothetical protein
MHYRDADPLEPCLSLEGAADDEWHAVPTVFDSKRRLFVACCIPSRLGKFEFTGGCKRVSRRVQSQRTRACTRRVRTCACAVTCRGLR